MLKTIQCVVLTFVCFPSLLCLAQTQASRMAEGDAFFQAQKWADAARVFEVVVESEPHNALVWFKLGSALHSAGEYAKAVSAFEEFRKLQPRQPQGAFRIARAYSRLGEKDRAFDWLDKAVQSGYANAAQLNDEHDLDPLRADSRFKVLADRLIAASRPCTAKAEYRQFDFFIGDWVVQNAQGQTVQTTSVRADLEQCVLIQDDHVPNGYNALAWHFYNSTAGRWQQKYLDVRGAFTDWNGEAKDGELRYLEIAPLSANAVHRSSFIRVDAERVRQIWEESLDAGKTWKLPTEYMYVRTPHSPD